jgi:hypothetical protein
LLGPVVRRCPGARRGLPAFLRGVQRRLERWHGYPMEQAVEQEIA